jgi:hypothetical protein
MGAIARLDLGAAAVQPNAQPYREYLHFISVVFRCGSPAAWVEDEPSHVEPPSPDAWRGVRELEGSNAKNKERGRRLVETPYIAPVWERAPL